MDVTTNVPLPALPAEESALYEGRIFQIAFQALIGVFYGLAMVIVSIRLILQIRNHRHLRLDDYLLIFACVCLTAGTGLCYAYVGDLYWTQELALIPTRFAYLLAENADLAATVDGSLCLSQIYPALVYGTIFFVKFAYLAFFRRLIDRIKPLVIYWRVVTGITIISSPLCIVTVSVGCTKRGLEAADRAQPFWFHRAVAVAAVGIFLDIVTDLSLVGVPIRLLWYVRVKPRQKFIVGVFLCLNLFMVIAAAVRVSGLSFRGKFDTVWLFVWSQTEACVAVSMISLTAFRSAFVESESSRARREGAKRPWYSSRINAIKRNRAQRLNDEEVIQALPKIPSAKLPGMRTFISGIYRSSHQTTNPTATFEGELDERPLHRGCE